jgi:hypothetical protein
MTSRGKALKLDTTKKWRRLISSDKHKNKRREGAFYLLWDWAYDSRSKAQTTKTKKVNHSFAGFGTGMVFLLATLYINPNNVIH